MIGNSTVGSRNRFHVLTRAVVAIVVVLGCAQIQAAEPSRDAKQTVDRLLRLVDERLAIAPDVAKAKWNSGDPINAPEREAQILGRVVVAATQAGVDEAFAQAFFQQQFDASKHIQHRLHDRWSQEKRAPFETPPDLADDVRPRLDRLTPQLIISLRDFQRVAESPGVRRYLESRAGSVHDGIGGTARAMALAPLLEETDS